MTLAYASGVNDMCCVTYRQRSAGNLVQMQLAHLLSICCLFYTPSSGAVCEIRVKGIRSLRLNKCPDCLIVLLAQADR